MLRIDAVSFGIREMMNNQTPLIAVNAKRRASQPMEGMGSLTALRKAVRLTVTTVCLSGVVLVFAVAQDVRPLPSDAQRNKSGPLRPGVSPILGTDWHIIRKRTIRSKKDQRPTRQLGEKVSHFMRAGKAVQKPSSQPSDMRRISGKAHVGKDLAAADYRKPVGKARLKSDFTSSKSGSSICRASVRRSLDDRRAKSKAGQARVRRPLKNAATTPVPVRARMKHVSAPQPFPIRTGTARVMRLLKTVVAERNSRPARSWRLPVVLDDTEPDPAVNRGFSFDSGPPADFENAPVATGRPGVQPTDSSKVSPAKSAPKKQTMATKKVASTVGPKKLSPKLQKGTSLGQRQAAINPPAPTKNHPAKPRRLSNHKKPMFQIGLRKSLTQLRKKVARQTAAHKAGKARPFPTRRSGHAVGNKPVVARVTDSDFIQSKSRATGTLSDSSRRAEKSPPMPEPIVIVQSKRAAKQPPAPMPPTSKPSGDEAPEAKGIDDFKSVGEIVVEIAVEYENKPDDFAADVFGKEKPETVDVTWIDQALCAPVFTFYHQPLYFEDANFERCGKTWGCLQPTVSAAHFYLTIPALPYMIGALPPNKPVESLGDCPWGCRFRFRDAYLPPFSLKGIAAQGAAVTGLIFLIP